MAQQVLERATASAGQQLALGHRADAAVPTVRCIIDPMTTPLPTFTTLGSGPTLLMLHDIGGSHLAFAPQVESFAMAGYRAVAWNMPGYGRSAPVDPYNFKALAQSCATLIDALQVPAVTLLGHGTGGMVAQELLARRPELVERLILCGALSRVGPAADDVPGRVAQRLGRHSTGPDDNDTRDPFASAQWQRDYRMLHEAPPDTATSLDAFAATRVAQLTGPAALPEGARLAAVCMAAVKPAIWRRALQASLEFDRSAELAWIRVPTLLIAGEHDAAAPPALLAEMANRIDGSSYAELRGVGHLMQLEAPEQFDALVLDFLARAKRIAKPVLH